jgi:hypothetical protein
MKVLLPDPVTPITAMMMSEELLEYRMSVCYLSELVSPKRALYLNSRLGASWEYSGGSASSAPVILKMEVTIFDYRQQQCHVIRKDRNPDMNNEKWWP